MDYISYSIDITRPLREKLQSRYISFSIMAHVLVAATAWYVAINTPKHSPQTLITVEITSPRMPIASAPVVAIPEVVKKITPSVVGAKKIPTLKQIKIIPSKVSSKSNGYAKAIPKQSTAKIAPVMAKPIVAKEATINDISDDGDIEKNIDELKTKNISVVPMDIDSDFQKVDNEGKQQIENTQKFLSEEANSITSETENEISSFQKENDSLSERTAALQQTHRKNYEKAMAVQKQEEYRPLVAGAPNGIRGLEQLKQMPGNARPQYSYQERLRGYKGQVIVWAYVGRDGAFEQIQLVKTTGYQSLDQKTIEALKRWRFYPGQEGWVELPFNWDLKGGPQEMPTLLRVKGRKVSEN